MKSRLAVLVLVGLLVACSDGAETAAPTTTQEPAPSTTRVGRAPSTTATTARDCGIRYTLGEVHGADPECFPAMLENATEALTEATDADPALTRLTPDAPTQAAALCRRFDLSGVDEALVLTLADWATGAAPKPAEDTSVFVFAAAAVYCPEYYEPLRTALTSPGP